MLRLKKTFATLLCFMGIFISSNAHAGIPTIDVSAIVSAVVNAVQAGQALQEFQKLQQQYSQMQQMEQIATGQRGFNELLTNPLVMNNLPSDFTAAVQNVRSSAAYAVERAKYPITNNPKLNAMYESAAAQKATMQDFYKRSSDVASAIAAQQRLQNATDPAGRAEAANSLAANKMVIDANNVALQALKDNSN